MAEVERFQQLAQEKEALNERWDEQNSLLVESHERVIAELTEDYEAKLAGGCAYVRERVCVLVCVRACVCVCVCTCMGTLCLHHL
jgi:hypothetical protein